MLAEDVRVRRDAGDDAQVLAQQRTEARRVEHGPGAEHAAGRPHGPRGASRAASSRRQGWSPRPAPRSGAWSHDPRHRRRRRPPRCGRAARAASRPASGRRPRRGSRPRVVEHLVPAGHTSRRWAKGTACWMSCACARPSLGVVHEDDLGRRPAAPGRTRRCPDEARADDADLQDLTPSSRAMGTGSTRQTSRQ